MPTLPLPGGGGALSGGDLPVTSEQDVLAALPLFLRPNDSAPVRDALIAALTAMFIGYQDKAAYAAAQADKTRATGTYLRGFAEELKTYAKSGESDDALRQRILATPGLVTPPAILAAANAILAPYTSVHAQFFESYGDGWYVRAASATPAWHSYVWKSTTSRSPTYPDRLYPDDVGTDGLVRPDSNPGGARVFKDTVGRLFVLRVPDLSPLDAQIAAVSADQDVSSARAFIGKGTSSSNTTYFRAVSATALSVYQSIANTVERIRGSSIRWTLLVDPKLTS